MHCGSLPRLDALSTDLKCMTFGLGFKHEGGELENSVGLNFLA